jgi:solute carrier family 8 (sodium/calcium exchanger)
MMVTYFPRGSITEFTNTEEFCSSWVLSPGISILPWYILAIFYFFWLVYLFLGIGVISDIFMEAIEVITSQTKVIAIPDPMYPDVMKPTKVAVWNPTFANLTLMALGSSAPEILLNCIETISTLGSTPGELGASTIVGSASFNFLVISGVSIYAVTTKNDNRTDDEVAEDGTGKGVKKVNDLGVFAITTTWSVLAYMWLFYVLLDYEVTTVEAGLTFAYFWILIAMAVGADIYNRKSNEAKMEEKLGLESAAEGRRELTVDE